MMKPQSSAYREEGTIHGPIRTQDTTNEHQALFSFHDVPSILLDWNVLVNSRPAYSCQNNNWVKMRFEVQDEK